jgi:dTDP-4-amino-4,6-dideoxygalactose transaminase
VAEVADLCAARGVALIEDIAQATGACCEGRKLGAFGAVGCASTHERKLICTGEGGFTVTDDARLAGRLREFRRYGMVGGNASAEEEARDGSGQSLGWNYKMNAFTAAVGISQVGKLEGKIRKRAGNAARIAAELRGLPGARVYAPAERSRPNHYALVVHVEAIHGKTAVDLARALAAEGIVSDTLEYDYRPLYEYPLFAGDAGYGSTRCPFSCPKHPHPYAVDPCPRAAALAASIVTLPTHEGLTDREVEYVAETFRRLHAGYREDA